MDFTTNKLRRKYSHLTKYERGVIQSKLKAKCSLRSIAREIGCAVNTIRNEIKRGLMPIYNGTRFRYDADYGNTIYEYNRKNCGRKCVAQNKKAFLEYVYLNFKKKNWSFDACVGRALLTGEFSRNDIERPDYIKERVEFGHWECDLVIGNRSNDDVLLTIVERKTRKSKIYRLPTKDSAHVMCIFDELKKSSGNISVMYLEV